MGLLKMIVQVDLSRSSQYYFFTSQLRDIIQLQDNKIDNPL